MMGIGLSLGMIVSGTDADFFDMLNLRGAYHICVKKVSGGSNSLILDLWENSRI